MKIPLNLKAAKQMRPKVMEIFEKSSFNIVFKTRLLNVNKD